MAVDFLEIVVFCLVPLFFVAHRLGRHELSKFFVRLALNLDCDLGDSAIEPSK